MKTEDPLWEAHKRSQAALPWQKREANFTHAIMLVGIMLLVCLIIGSIS